MTVRELLAELQHLPRDLEVLVFEAGCEDYCEREVDELDPDQEAALRRLRAAFGFVEVLRIGDHHDDQDHDDEPLEEGEEAPPADR
jgi:hypothetical protein